MAVEIQPNSEKYEMANQPLMVATGIPPGLEYLSSMTHVKISQIVSVMEVVIGWERNNKYSIMNDQEQQFLMAKEKTDCCTRQLCGPTRPFYMGVWTNQEQEVFSMDRPLRCQGACGCCCLQEMTVCSPPGTVIGIIREQWKCWIPQLTIEDPQGNILFDVHGRNPCVIQYKCGDVAFKVHSHTDGTEVGQIVKKWRGCTELCGFNRFECHFPQDLDVRMKAMFIACTFLADFMFFEVNRNN